MKGGATADWTRGVARTLGFTLPPCPRGDPGSPVAFLGGGVGRGWGSDRPAVSPRPAIDPLCVPGQVTSFLESQFPQSLKEGLQMQYQHHRSLQRAPAIAKLEHLISI